MQNLRDHLGMATKGFTCNYTLRESSSHSFKIQFLASSFEDFLRKCKNSEITLAWHQNASPANAHFGSLLHTVSKAESFNFISCKLGLKLLLENVESTRSPWHGTKRLHLQIHISEVFFAQLRKQRASISFLASLV